MSCYDECISNWNNIAKPLGSLGEFETLTAKIAAIQKTSNIDIKKKAALVFCADNGVVENGVSSYKSEVTAAMKKLHYSGKSSVAVMANASNTDLFVYEFGTTSDMSKGSAMTLIECKEAINKGMMAVKECCVNGYKLIAVGETGIGNTTTAAAVASVLLGKNPAELTGRGAGLTDERLKQKISIIKNSIEINNPNAEDVFDVLTKVGGFDICAMTGAFLGGAKYGVCMVIDGVISLVAALCAVRLAPNVKDFIISSHLSEEPAAEFICRELELEPIIRAKMRLGEGTGAVLLFPLLDTILHVYKNAAKFSDL